MGQMINNEQLESLKQKKKTQKSGIRLYIFAMTGAFALLPVILVSVSYVKKHNLLNPEFIYIPAFIVFFVIFAFSIYKITSIQEFACPNCGEKFFGELKYFHLSRNPYASNCQNCGLKLDQSKEES